MKNYRNWPLFVAIISDLAAFGILLIVHPLLFETIGELSMFFLFLGGAYTHFFEYFYHRFVLHTSIRLKLLLYLKKNHLGHHIVFAGDNFQSSDPAQYHHITSKWWVFPGGVAVHYPFALLLMPETVVISFFLGSLIHYVFRYEIPHWCTHVKNNGLDRFLFKLPIIGYFRKRGIERHREHHESIKCNLNFSGPYLGDRTFRTLRS